MAMSRAIMARNGQTYKIGRKLLSLRSRTEGIPGIAILLSKAGGLHKRGNAAGE